MGISRKMDRIIDILEKEFLDKKKTDLPKVRFPNSKFGHVEAIEDAVDAMNETIRRENDEILSNYRDIASLVDDKNFQRLFNKTVYGYAANGSEPIIRGILIGKHEKKYAIMKRIDNSTYIKYVDDVSEKSPYRCAVCCNNDTKYDHTFGCRCCWVKINDKLIKDYNNEHLNQPCTE